MKKKVEGTLIALAVLFFAGGVLLVQSGQLFFESWNRNTQRLTAAQEKLRRLEGWVLVREKVESLHGQAWGDYAGLSGQRAYWAGLEGFQQVAQSQGLTVTEIRPVILPARTGQTSVYRLDAKVTGPVDKISLLLKQLSDRVPGVDLESVQISPLSNGETQGMIRVLIQGDPSVGA